MIACVEIFFLIRRAASRRPHEIRSILMRKGVILNFKLFLKVIKMGPISGGSLGSGRHVNNADPADVEILRGGTRVASMAVAKEDSRTRTGHVSAARLALHAGGNPSGRQDPVHKTNSRYAMKSVAQRLRRGRRIDE